MADERRASPWPDGYLHSKFAIRKGTSAPDKGTFYYIGFASAKLNFMSMVKQAMMKVTDVPDELCFSAFYRVDSERIPEYVRKTDDRYEAQVIWQKLGSLGTVGRNQIIIRHH